MGQPSQGSVRHAVHARDGYRCRYCGCRTTWKKRDLPYSRTVDHLIPRSLGGRFNIINLVTSCKSCNEKKLAMSLAEAGMRLLPVPEYTPEQILWWVKKQRKDCCCNCLRPPKMHARPPHHGGPRACPVGGTYFLARRHLDYLQAQGVQ